MNAYTLNQAMTEYLMYLAHKGRSQKTIENYGAYLTRLVLIAGDIDTRRLSVAHISALHESLAGRGLGRSTINYHLIALRGFLVFCKRRGMPSLDSDMIEIGKTIRAQVSVLNPTEVERLLHTANPNNLIGLRDRAILEMLFATGLRVSELASLNINQVDIAAKQFQVRGKGSKDRLVFLTERSATWITTYLNQRYDGSPALFVEYASGNEDRLQVRSIQRMVAHYAKLALINKAVSPHTLRHSFATNLLSNGADIRSVQELLGHSSITTTQFYTHVTNTQLQAAHEQFSALGGRNR